MPESAARDYPLAPELGLMKYFRDITGTASRESTYKPGVAVAGQAPLIDEAGLSGIMTEWLRGNGRFLDTMHNQNQSGLYNSSTRRLVANDLTAQAALKAATANQDIGKVNAELSTRASIENAKMQSLANSSNAKLSMSGNSGKNKLLDLALAAGMNIFKGSENKKGEKKVSTEAAGGTSGTSDVSSSPTTYNDSGGPIIDDTPFAGDIAPLEFSSGGLALDTFDLGGLGSQVSELGSLDLSSGNFGSSEEFEPAEFDLGNFFSGGTSSGLSSVETDFDFSDLFDFDW
jgi:hypothetical protein